MIRHHALARFARGERSLRFASIAGDHADCLIAENLANDYRSLLFVLGAAPSAESSMIAGEHRRRFVCETSTYR